METKEKIIIGEGLGVGEVAYQEVLHPGGGVVGAGVGLVTHSIEGLGEGGAAAAKTVASRGFLGVPAGNILQGMTGALPLAFVFGLLSVWDHNQAMRVLRSEFESEIGAQLGKSPESVTVKDMELVAKDNPVIADAIKRSRRQRNLSIAITTIGTLASVALAVVCAPAVAGIIAGLSLSGIGATAASLLINGAIGFLGFMAVDKTMDYVGTKALRLEEPPIRAAELHPEVQGELSVPSQIRLLVRAQARRKPITAAQVLTVFVSANPALQQQVAQRYGAPFDKLPGSIKARVINDLDPALNLTQLTDDINNHVVRTQELAFAVSGQHSGVTKLTTPNATKLEAAQSKLEEAQAKIESLTQKVEQKAETLVHEAEAGISNILHPDRRSTDKLAFANTASVSVVVPDNQNVAKVASEGKGAGASLKVPAPSSASWADRSQQTAPATTAIA